MPEGTKIRWYGNPEEAEQPDAGDVLAYVDHTGHKPDWWHLVLAGEGRRPTRSLAQGHPARHHAGGRNPGRGGLGGFRPHRQVLRC